MIMAPAPKVQMKVDRDLPPNLVQEIKKSAPLLGGA
jgi:hypothetical protein